MSKNVLKGERKVCSSHFFVSFLNCCGLIGCHDSSGLLVLCTLAHVQNAHPAHMTQGCSNCSLTSSILAYLCRSPHVPGIPRYNPVSDCEEHVILADTDVSGWNTFANK